MLLLIFSLSRNYYTISFKMKIFKYFFIIFFFENYLVNISEIFQVFIMLFKINKSINPMQKHHHIVEQYTCALKMFAPIFNCHLIGFQCLLEHVRYQDYVFNVTKNLMSSSIITFTKIYDMLTIFHVFCKSFLEKTPLNWGLL